MEYSELRHDFSWDVWPVTITLGTDSLVNVSSMCSCSRRKLDKEDIRLDVWRFLWALLILIFIIIHRVLLELQKIFLSIVREALLQFVVSLHYLHHCAVDSSSSQCGCFSLGLPSLSLTSHPLFLNLSRDPWTDWFCSPWSQSPAEARLPHPQQSSLQLETCAGQNHGESDGRK